MNFKLIIPLFLAILTNGVLCEEFSFVGYRLLRLFPKTQHQFDLIGKWESDDSEFDVWAKSGEIVTVLVSPKAYIKYQLNFRSIDLSYVIVDENIQNKIEEQKQSIRKNTKADNNIVGKFARYPEILNFIETTKNENKDLVSTLSIGKTYENRDLRVIVLKTNTSQRNVWIDCGIHAREWITPSTCIYFIDKLIRDYRSGNPAAVSLLSYFEFHILPLQNPDGYEYTWNTYRLWRKNRSKNPGSTCIGTDLNRNWGYKWMTGGSSNNPCSDLYAGSKADSEIETQSIENYILSIPNRWDSFLTIHTYGQWWFTTWGYTTDLPEDYPELEAKAKIGAEAIQSVYNTKWIYGSSSRILYVGSGGSEDWAQGVAGIKYSYCLELRPGQSGPDSNYGFTLPEDRAPKAGEETYQGITAFLKSIRP
jgi:murein tripeptide amidase MpaA